MYSSQNINSVDFTEVKLAQPKEVDFYVHTDKTQQNLVPQDTHKIRIDKILQEIVESSNLFKEEDMKRFVFE
ncbi:MAG TPA: hypothetical protein ENI76_06155 [Ignavibacteria bacterium]|nr:hypothetical protein [Ignavibacteria bacterium]